MTQTAADPEVRYQDLGTLMGLMSGAEKHAPAAASTLDVLWVLYDRVLRVGPGNAGLPGGTGSCSPRGTGRWRTTPCSPRRGSSPPTG